MNVSNVKVFGLDESILASAYPMSTETGPFGNSIEVAHKVSERLDRAKQLAKTKTGSGHDQFLTGIVVQFDVDFTIKAWVEAERYHFLDFVSSTSTMHRLMAFELNGAYNEYVDKRMVGIMKELQCIYNETKTEEAYLRMIYSNPSGMKLTARITTNYRQLKTVYQQRKNHRLPEWREFCDWIKALPLFKELILA